jgi:hypothetical protein
VSSIKLLQQVTKAVLAASGGEGVFEELSSPALPRHLADASPEAGTDAEKFVADPNAVDEHRNADDLCAPCDRACVFAILIPASRHSRILGSPASRKLAGFSVGSHGYAAASLVWSFRPGRRPLVPFAACLASNAASCSASRYFRPRMTTGGEVEIRILVPTVARHGRDAVTTPDLRVGDETPRRRLFCFH